MYIVAHERDDGVVTVGRRTMDEWMILPYCLSPPPPRPLSPSLSLFLSPLLLTDHWSLPPSHVDVDVDVDVLLWLLRPSCMVHIKISKDASSDWCWASYLYL